MSHVGKVCGHWVSHQGGNCRNSFATDVIGNKLGAVGKIWTVIRYFDIGYIRQALGQNGCVQISPSKVPLTPGLATNPFFSVSFFRLKFSATNVQKITLSTSSQERTYEFLYIDCLDKIYSFPFCNTGEACAEPRLRPRSEYTSK